MPKKQTQKGAGAKKHGRQKRKAAARGGACSLFVRGKIPASQYFEMTGQKYS